MPKIVDHDAYRRELLEKAFARFAETGYGSLSMKDLAAELEISPGLLYRYFAGKEEMFHMMVRQFVQMLLGELAVALAAEPTLEGKVNTVFEHLEHREKQYQQLHLALNDFIRLIGLNEFQSSPVVQELIHAHIAFIQQSLQLTREQTVILITYSLGVLLSGFLLPSRTPISEHKAILLQLLRGETAYKVKEHQP